MSRRAAPDVRHQFQLSADKHTLWINSGVTGTAIARFSSKGIDIHHDAAQTGEHCLFCKPGPDPTNAVPLEAEYALFREKLLEHHQLAVPKNVRMRTR